MINDQPLVTLQAQINNLVNLITDRGITRIKRSHYVKELLDMLTIELRERELIQVGDLLTIDTIASQVIITGTTTGEYTVLFQGDEDLCEPVLITVDPTAIKYNNLPVSENTLIVLTTSHLLRSTNDELTVTIDP